MDLALAIPVFHRWIQEQALPGLLVDVADYRHVPEGPGVVLVAHEAIYGLDLGGGRLGLLYNRRTRLDAAPAEALPQAFRAALEACRKLEQEPEFRRHPELRGRHLRGGGQRPCPWRPTTPPPAPACAPSWNRCWTACGAPAVTASSPSASPATAWA